MSGARLACAALTLVAALAGCTLRSRGTPASGQIWSQTHAALDSLGALGRDAQALALAEAARARHAQPDWLAADLAATAAEWRTRAALPLVAREALRAADRGVLRVQAMLTTDSLSAAHALARTVRDARLAALGDTAPDVARARMQLASVAFRMARGGEADSLAREVLEKLPVAVRTAHPLAAEAEEMIGRVIKNFSGGSRRDDAMAHYQRALEIRRRCYGERSLEVADVYHEMGNLERAARRGPAALAHLERALSIRRERLGDHHDDVASTLSAIAYLSSSQGDWPAAERSIRAALAAGPDPQLLPPTTRALRTGLLGQSLRRMGRTDEAIPMLAQAAAAAETTWSRLPQDGAGSVQAGLSVYRELALALAAAGRDEEAFENLERGQSRLWEHDSEGDARAGLLARVQRVLPADAALVAWPRTSVSPPGGDYPMWACVVRATGPVHWVRIERNPDWPKTGDTVRDALIKELVRNAQWPLRVSDTRVVDSLATRMGGECVTPIEPYLEGASRLIVFGSELMATLSVLRDAHGARLSDRFALTQVPSALAYATLAERAQRMPAERASRALLVGAPELSRADAERWAPLAGAAEELRDLAHLFHEATVLTGREASAARLNALAHGGALEHIGVLHIATHIEIDPARQMQSAFVLAPDAPASRRGSRVSAEEIADQWHVNAQLVSLAGCRSALGLHSASEGWLGLQSAFLTAGAQSVLVSLWRVDDAATSRLMVEFHTRLLAAGGARDAADALRLAQRAVRDYRTSDGATPYAHPAYWAGFALVGNGGIR